jgi:hypothetical protein
MAAAMPATSCHALLRSDPGTKGLQALEPVSAMNGPPRSALDRPAARVVAVLVAVLALAALGWINRHAFLPRRAPPPAAAADDPFRRCMAARGADIDRMVQEGSAKPDQAELFRSRAEAMCRAEAAKAGGGPPGGPPGLPPGMQPSRRF